MVQNIPTPYETDNNPNTAYYRVHNQPAPYIGDGFRDYYSNYAAMEAVGQAEAAARAAGTQLSYEQRLGIAADAAIGYRKQYGIDTTVPKTREQIEREYRTPNIGNQYGQGQPTNAIEIAARVPGNVNQNVLALAAQESNRIGQNQLQQRNAQYQPPHQNVLDLTKTINEYGGTVIGENGVYRIDRGTKPEIQALDLTKTINEYGGTVIGENGKYHIYHPTLDLTKGEYFSLDKSPIEQNYRNIINAPSDISSAIGSYTPLIGTSLRSGDILGAIDYGVKGLDTTSKAIGNAIESVKQTGWLATEIQPTQAKLGMEAAISAGTMAAQTLPFVLSVPAMLKGAITNPSGVPGAAIDTTVSLVKNIGTEAIQHPGSLPGNILGLYVGGKVLEPAISPISKVSGYATERFPVKLDVGINVGNERYTTLYTRNGVDYNPVAGFSTGESSLFKPYLNPTNVLANRQFSVEPLYNVRNPAESATPGQVRLVRPLFQEMSGSTPEAGYANAALALRNILPYSEKVIPQTVEHPLGTTQIKNFNPEVHTGFVTEISSIPGNKFVGSVTLADIVGTRYMRDVGLSDVDVSIPQGAQHNLIQSRIKEMVSANVPELKLQGYQGKFTTIDQEHPFSVMLQGNGKALDVRTFEAPTTGGGVANIQTPEYSIESKMSRLSTGGYSIKYDHGDISIGLGGKKPTTDLMDVIAASRGISKRAYLYGDIEVGSRYETIASNFENYLNKLYPESPITFENPLKTSEVQTAKINLLSKEISRAGRVYSGVPLMDEDYYGKLSTYNENVYTGSEVSGLRLLGAIRPVRESGRTQENYNYGSPGREQATALYDIYPGEINIKTPGETYRIPRGNLYENPRAVLVGSSNEDKYPELGKITEKIPYLYPGEISIDEGNYPSIVPSLKNTMPPYPPYLPTGSDLVQSPYPETITVNPPSISIPEIVLPPSIIPTISFPPGENPPGENPPDKTKFILSGNPYEDRFRKKKKQTSRIFPEYLPVLEPLEELGGIKKGKDFYRTLGRGKIAAITPELPLSESWIDFDVPEAIPKANKKVSEYSGVEFYRTATKQEREKTGKQIMTRQKGNFDVMSMAGISKKNRRWGL